jgi:UDP-N-acetyl-D-galactosamine dehydrogenase
MSAGDKNIKIAVIGLGYVGLPLAIEFSKKYDVLGFDIDQERIEELRKGEDHTQEADIEILRKVTKKTENEKSTGLFFSADAEKLKNYNHFIVTVPTPIDRFNNPDLTPLLSASRTIGKALKPGDIVIYESTTYPGCTEEDCVPELEKNSGLKFNQDFYCGYSPERINPGDKVNTLVKIKKVTSGSTPEIADKVDALYASIIEAGTHKAPNLKVAEASKAIENAQRDVNISFMNELALIFERIGIDTNDVLEAAGTKWNFLKHSPGLVGGHCIGVDPYYLVHKAKSVGYHSEVILSGRRVNNMISGFIANKIVKLLIQEGFKIKGSRALIMGITFKENCPDTRNTKVVEIHRELVEFGLKVDIWDPLAKAEIVKEEYGIPLLKNVDPERKYEVIVLAVAHDEFKKFDFRKYKEGGTVIYDAKNFVDRDIVNARL